MGTTDTNAVERLLELFSDIRSETTFPYVRPLLAHYTTLPVLERILDNDEIWFSNPLLTNDVEEVRFGILNGAEVLEASTELESACRTPNRRLMFLNHFQGYVDHFANQFAFDTYIFCLSEHDRDNFDGSLSMWRGYGNNGNGAAIVFDTSALQAIDSSPFILSRVEYASKDARISWLKDKVSQCAALLDAVNLPDSQLHVAAHYLFERIKLFALFSKHDAFREEREWRVVYLTERDTNQQMSSMFDYALGPRGPEPKLKFKVRAYEGITAPHFSLEGFVDRIVLGPSHTSQVAMRTIQRMLLNKKKTSLSEKVYASQIPFRPV